MVVSMLILCYCDNHKLLCCFSFFLFYELQINEKAFDVFFLLLNTKKEDWKCVLCAANQRVRREKECIIGNVWLMLSMGLITSNWSFFNINDTFERGFKQHKRQMKHLKIIKN